MKVNILKSMKIQIPESLNITGKVRCILEDAITGEIEIKEYDNLIVNTGKVAIARRLVAIGLYANEGACTYGATGLDATAPAATDTQLGTELARKLKASSSYDAVTRTGTIRTYFTTTESNGTLKEFGMFGEAATGVANSGTLINHCAINITKDATKALTIEIIFTVS